MSYAGVSVIADGKLVGSSTSPRVDAGAASGYHLLVVEDYSPTHKPIWSRSFTVGGQCWGIYYNPGGNHPDIADFISLELCLMDITSCPVKAQFEFSFAQDTDNQDPARINVSEVLEFRAYYESHKKLIKREALEKHIKHNSFTIRCDVVVMDDDIVAVTPPIIVVPPSDMRQNFTEFLLAGEGTDVVFIVVGGEKVAAHRCVLAACSPVFKALLFDTMKERTSLTTTATIVQQVGDMDAPAFKALLGFIYGDTLPVWAEDDNKGVLLRQLLVAADRYDLPRLREMCENKLCEVPSSDMQRNFTDLLQSREGTDVVFQVGGETFAAHRYILTARSAVFRALHLGPMKKEGTSTVVHVDDMDTRVFEAMLGFIYGESLPVPADHENEGVMLKHLLVAADRYDVPRLRLLCEKKLCEHICVSTAMTILALAEQHGCNGLKKACYDFLRFRDNLRAAVATDGFDHLCRSCPPVMKDVILAMLQIS